MSDGADLRQRSMDAFIDSIRSCPTWTFKGPLREPRWCSLPPGHSGDHDLTLEHPVTDGGPK